MPQRSVCDPGLDACAPLQQRRGGEGDDAGRDQNHRASPDATRDRRFVSRPKIATISSAPKKKDRYRVWVIDPNSSSRTKSSRVRAEPSAHTAESSTIRTANARP